MSLNPLLKLKRFASAPSTPSAPVQGTSPASPIIQKAAIVRAKPPVGPPLPPDEIQKLINPLAHNCKHCGTNHTKVNFVFYSESPSYKGFYCFECWGHHYKYGKFPAAAPARVLPKKVTNGINTA